jgi:hypothetical protein
MQRYEQLVLSRIDGKQKGLRLVFVRAVSEAVLASKMHPCPLYRHSQLHVRSQSHARPIRASFPVS